MESVTYCQEVNFALKQALKIHRECNGIDLLFL